MTSSSLSTVDEQYPRAQSFSPVKFLSRPRSCWAIAALLPLIYPTMDTTEYLGRMLINMCIWSGITWPSKISHPFCTANLLRIGPSWVRKTPKNAFFLYFGIKIYTPKHYGLDVRILLYSFCFLSYELGGSWKETPFFTYRSNLYSRPSLAGGLLGINYCKYY